MGTQLRRGIRAVAYRNGKKSEHGNQSLSWRVSKLKYMNFDKTIIDAIGEFNPLKLEALQSITLQIEEGEWPITAALQLSYDGQWIIFMKLLHVRKAKLPILGGGLMDLGEPAIHKSQSGEYTGLFEFWDELKGYHIVSGDIIITGVRRLG
jgi:hypothetical protein